MTSNRLDSIVQLITAVCIFIFVLALAYFTTKFTAGFQKSKLASPNVEVIETFRLTQNKYIQIVRVGKKYIALGIGKEEIEFLSEISDEDLLLETFSDQSPDSPELFKEILAKVGKKSKK